MDFKRRLQALFRQHKNAGSFTDFSRLVTSDKKAFIFFSCAGLINLRKNKCICGNDKLLKVFRPSYMFGFRWACYSSSHAKVHYINPLEGTIFRCAKISLLKIFDIMLNWFFRKPFDEVEANTKCSSKTISKWYKRFRKVCQESGKRNFKIGGPGHWVELDETLLFKRKYHRGHRIAGEQFWIFGGIDRNTKQRFIVRVENRKKRTLWPLIRKYIRRQSILVTDDFASYKGIEAKGYSSHEIVVHRYNFRNPQFPDVYTNGVECVWSKLKRHIKRSGSKDYVDAAIQEFLYRSKLQLKYGRRHFGIKLWHFLKDLRKTKQ